MAEKENQHKKLFGLVGKNISYSFSKGYFAEKFEQEGLSDHEYVNFDIQSIDEFPQIIHEFRFRLKGLNVTIPYKQEVFQHLDKVHKTAKKVGAVNTIRFTKRGNLKGYNTDVFGFKNSLMPLLKEHHTKALILGTGGASKAIAYVLKSLEIEYFKVSRNPMKKKEISYDDLSRELVVNHPLIINCTPLGTFPNVTQKPNIPYQYLDENHLLYDLIYNPEKTAFLKEGEERGAQIKNGLEMLIGQAEEAWRIWNK
jgi:shikimate dehydrogenase